ncbi:pentatricopeptide repeat-containing protein At1g08070, chloroplastic-like [Salvia miltiorrhiza]|uniref:pentatricopeptide repeat-containing protein At1g08070, chloroplastic-like n=1 Tax=Salvia miltiorrhiza TaxID=226208 RepID=UPI0025ABC6B8|nr:pentatricopeptide repeat-containing protein At1g08070, chloroplastic-like [Salvia miltiorrhiza]
MVFALSTFPSHFPTAKTAIPKFPENPKTLILEKCKTTKDLNQVHASFIKTRLLHHPAAAEPLLEAAALLLPDSTIDYAFSIFRTLEHPDASAYNIMIRGFNKEQSFEKSILLFRQLIQHFVRPDPFTYSGILKACSKLVALKEGEQIHAHVLKSMDKLDRSEFVENSLVYMYASCGLLQSARKVFDEMSERSPVAWSSMFSGYARCGQWQEVVGLFRKMRKLGIRFNEVTLISVLKACGRLGDLGLGEWIDEYAAANGLLKNDSLITSLVDMYAKCGRLETARRLFDSMSNKDVVAWSAMISGYSHSDQCREALALFHDMQNANVAPNEVTMVSVLSSCGVLGALETGKWVHSYIKRKKLKLSVNLSTSLIDFYAKCGCVDAALEVFHGAPCKNAWTWTALIQGLASNGRGEMALRYFNLMLREKVEPNDVTFIGVLCACNHAGLVDQGRGYLVGMSRDFGIEPRIEHYGCVVDMLGRAGLVEDAHELITSMPIKPNAVIWRTLLASCRLHKIPEIAEEALKQVVRLEPAHSGDYILLSSAYTSAGRLEEATKLRDEMKRMGIKKSPGCSYIEVDGIVHEFLAEDKGHPQSREVYEAVHEVMERIKRAGYEPDAMQARMEAEEDGDKEASVSHHSEKLAMAFGLIRTSPGTTIRVSKNLRICNDCHNAAKVISKVFSREIVVRDRSRFHHFKDGSCSCHDFW